MDSLFKRLEQMTPPNFENLIITVSGYCYRTPDWSSGEAQRLQAITSVKRRDAWQHGRVVLKALLAKMGQPIDTAHLSWPHPQLSLSHSGRWAFAVGKPDGQGVGIDFEAWRVIPQRAEHFFLTSSEKLDGLGAEERAQARLRLWTVKEALFKADLHNARSLLTHYTVADPLAWEGEAYRGDRRFVYTSLPWDGGVVSIALGIGP
jgi:4'-phosphopantetheinyl transferase EntD